MSYTHFTLEERKYLQKLLSEGLSFRKIAAILERSPSSISREVKRNKAKLVIELDGSQHYDEIDAKKDAERTAFLEGYGLRVIRIPNNEVSRNFSGVCEYIDAAVKQSLRQLR